VSNEKEEKYLILPVQAAKDVAEKYDLDQVILLCRDMKDNIVHVVTYGQNEEDKGMAALDGAKIRQVLAAVPATFEEAIEAAEIVKQLNKEDF